MAEKSKKIFVGYDRSEHNAYVVCRKSILRHASIPVEIIPLRQEVLRSLGMYWRPRGPKAATEFTYTRFLVPALSGYKGCALFVDTDFLFLADIAELFALYDPFYAVQCIHHEHQPMEQEKMGGAVQTQYERKNWTSLMLFNCGHPDVVNHLSLGNIGMQNGTYLLRMEWVHDEFMGELPPEWNWLCGHSSMDLKPKAVHFTRGLPSLHAGCENEPYADLWLKEMQS